MKHLLASVLVLIIFNCAQSQSVTIVPDSTRAVNLQGIAWISTVKVSGAPAAVLPTPTLPVQGEGTRMMWIPSRSAFRAGTVENRGNNQDLYWNSSNIGLFSFAGGYNTLASGRYGLAFGENTRATGEKSSAFGIETNAAGYASTAIGYLNLSSGAYSLASGIATQSPGQASGAFGFYSLAPSFTSFAIGRWNTTFPGSNASEWVATDPLLIAGNGTDANNRANAMVLYKNGNMTIAGALTQNSDFRLKKGITSLTNVLPKLNQLRGVNYYFDASKRADLPNTKQIGFIAQELESLFPELVLTDSEGYKSVDYARLTPILVEAIKELAQKIQSLELKLNQQTVK